jgi:hypothetical protein
MDPTICLGGRALMRQVGREQARSQETGDPGRVETVILLDCSLILPTIGFPRFKKFQLDPKTGFFTGTILREESAGRGSNPRAPIRRELPCAGVFVNGGGAGYVRLSAPGSGSGQPVSHGAVEIQPDVNRERAEACRVLLGHR